MNSTGQQINKPVAVLLLHQQAATAVLCDYSERIGWLKRLRNGFWGSLDSNDIPAEFKTAEWRQSV